VIGTAWVKSANPTLCLGARLRLLAHVAAHIPALMPGSATEPIDEPASAARKSAKAADAKPSTAAARLAKLGLRRSVDLVLHLPLRYEDETTLEPIRDAIHRAGMACRRRSKAK
jgi:ATP-dependent DNA helicase RecG